MKSNPLLFSILLVGSLVLPCSLLADKKVEDKETKVSIAELIKDKTDHKGFVHLYQDQETGSLLLSLVDEQLNKPMIYFIHTVNGLFDAGHVKGMLRETKLLEFRKRFDRIEVVSTTPRYLIDSESAIHRSKGTNISPAILSSMKIKAFDKESKRYVVEVDPMFLSEQLHKITPYPTPKVPGAPPIPPRFDAGKLSEEKTKYVKISNYPDNTDVVVEYVFENSSPSIPGGKEVSDARSTLIQMQHSFVKLPENNYKSRRDDPRIGYFNQQFDNLTSDKWAPYEDVINRWYLVKKDPNAEISEPIEPIVWWIENTTPIEWRDTIKNAALQWNIAFEKAGFKNALQVKIQPDDASWDAGDIRYNVLRWTSSPRPRFGGYGPSVANPLTGQIISSDIMLEYIFMKNRWFADKLYTHGTSLDEQDTDFSGDMYCSAGFLIQQSLTSASVILDAQGGQDINNSELVRQALTSLILHELGHTLGLNHNMKASQKYDHKQVHDASLTQGSLTGSVMDYAPTNIAPLGAKQGDFADTTPGEYDIWAIEYGYSESLSDPVKEKLRLDKILSRSTEKLLAFGNDAEDMRAPGRHIDPRVMVSDMSSDAIGYGIDRMELIKSTLTKLMSRTTHSGESYQELTLGLNSLVRAYFSSSVVASRYIGGIYVDRAMVGQKGGTRPFTPVSLEEQKRAMDLLSKYLFAANVLSEATPLFAYLQMQRRGFDNFGKNEDPKLHALILTAQQQVFSHLFHKSVLQRITDSTLYGNEYDVNQLFGDLTTAIFSEDSKTDVTSIRQNLQYAYVKHLIAIGGLKNDGGFDYFSRLAATTELTRISKIGRYQTGVTAATKAHRDYLRRLIEDTFGK